MHGFPGVELASQVWSVIFMSRLVFFMDIYCCICVYRWDWCVACDVIFTRCRPLSVGLWKGAGKALTFDLCSLTGLGIIWYCIWITFCIFFCLFAGIGTFSSLLESRSVSVFAPRHQFDDLYSLEIIYPDLKIYSTRLSHWCFLMNLLVFRFSGTLTIATFFIHVFAFFLSVL